MKVTIDGIEIMVQAGTTVLQAADFLRISIPTMCYSAGFHNHPSCMVCIVKDLGSGKMVPACAIPVYDGMKIQTHSPEIREIRREALELLLGDHVGDCEAPCRLSCPAFMNIPLMNRLIAMGHFREALVTVREEIAIPLILGYICPAPCEKACHRREADEAVAICMLKRAAAQFGNQESGVRSWGSWDEGRRTKDEGRERRVAVIGSGPAGLSAAYYIRKSGHECVVFEKAAEAGGAMRYDIPETKLPREALNTEISGLEQMGVTFSTGTEISREVFEKDILPVFDAVILATGSRAQHPVDAFRLPPVGKGEIINRKTCATGRPGVFGCGSVLREQTMAVRSAAQGKLAALEASLYLKSGNVKRMHYHFHSAISRLAESEIEEYMKESSRRKRFEPSGGFIGGFTPEEAMAEAARCMHCDCRKPYSCKLRLLSDEYHANRKRYAGPGRKSLTKDIRHELLIYENEKCIRCGLCVEITARKKEKLGLTFIGRGFDIRIGVPMNKDLADAIEQSAFDCAENCPTGALSFRDQEEGVEHRVRHRMSGNGWEKMGGY